MEWGEKSAPHLAPLKLWGLGNEDWFGIFVLDFVVIVVDGICLE